MIRLKPTLVLMSACLLALFSMPAVAGDTVKAKVIQVADGDTVIIRTGGHIYNVQIHSIDAPELSQEYGREAYELVRRLTKGKKVSLEGVERMDENSWTARVSVGGQDVASQLVEAGLAWATAETSGADLEEAQQKAKSSREGLWASTNPTPPWEYREKA